MAVTSLITSGGILKVLLKLGAVALVANEVRGLVLAGPVLYAAWAAGGTWAAIYLAACSLGGIALSVIVPLWIARRFTRQTG